MAWLISSAIPVPAAPVRCVVDQRAIPGPRRAGTEKQEPLIGDLLSCDAQRGEDPGEGDSRGALDVVIECADLVPVALENRHGADVREVLPLDAAFRIELLHRGHELVDKFHVFATSDAVLPEAEVERVVEQSWVVRADIKNDRQAVSRRHAGTSRAEGELPN